MTKQPFNVTNEKLFYAHFHLEQLNHLQNNNLLNTQLAYGYSCVFHSYSAIVAFIHEIAHNYQLQLINSMQHIELLDHYQNQLSQKSNHTLISPEFTELTTLMSDPESWLSQLEKYYLAYWEISPTIVQNNPQKANLISSTKSTEQSFSISQCNSLCSELSQFIERLRSTMQEW